MASRKRISLDKAAGKLAAVTEKYLQSLSPYQRRKKLKALDALAKIAASRIRRNRGGSPSRSGGTHRTPAYPVAAKAR
jgi:hypothetical protein